MCRALGDATRTENFEGIGNTEREVDVFLPICAWTLRSIASAFAGRTLGQLICNKDTMTQVAFGMSWNESLRKKKSSLKK